MRRGRYYAYEARQGGVLWIDAKIHSFIQGRPHTVSHFQCTKFTGETRLMSLQEAKDKQRTWCEALTRKASAIG